jgi:hypothetical protein
MSLFLTIFQSTITSLLARLIRLERQDIYLRVYVANANPSDHPLLHSWLLGIVDSYVSAQNLTSQADFQTLVDLESAQRFPINVAIDSANALDYCYHNSTAPYIALFEGASYLRTVGLLEPNWPFKIYPDGRQTITG